MRYQANRSNHPTQHIRCAPRRTMFPFRVTSKKNHAFLQITSFCSSLQGNQNRLIHNISNFGKSFSKNIPSSARSHKLTNASSSSTSDQLRSMAAVELPIENLQVGDTEPSETSDRPLAYVHKIQVFWFLFIWVFTLVQVVAANTRCRCD